MTFPSNANTSATGGYLLPAAPGTAPGGLTFTQFLQTVFVGISGLPGGLVRPRWQINPPEQPDITVNWLAIASAKIKTEGHAFSDVDSNGNNTTQRHEDLELQCAFYGPDAEVYCTALRDGFEVQQNLEALRAANMGFVSATDALRIPDLVNERWVNRFEMSVFLRREITRVYPVLNFVSAVGSLKAVVSGNLKSIPIQAGAHS